MFFFNMFSKFDNGAELIATTLTVKCYSGLHDFNFMRFCVIGRLSPDDFNIGIFKF